MEKENILHIIGDIASVFTVIGGFYGLIKWIQSRKAKVVFLKHQYSDQSLYTVCVYNTGIAIAYDIKITSASSKYKIETSAQIPHLQPGEQGEIGFAFRQKASKLPLCIHWIDGMGKHKKQIVLELCTLN